MAREFEGTDRPLASWSDGPTRDAILAFVESVVSGPDAVPEEQRVGSGHDGLDERENRVACGSVGPRRQRPVGTLEFACHV